MTDCGGCKGIGSHKRWCSVAVGPSASMFGKLAEDAEGLGDRVGANDPGVANMLYRASGILREHALTRKAEWQARHG